MRSLINLCLPLAGASWINAAVGNSGLAYAFGLSAGCVAGWSLGELFGRRVSRWLWPAD